VDLDKLQKIITYLEGHIRLHVQETSLDIYYSGGCVSIPVYSFGVEENSFREFELKLSREVDIPTSAFVTALYYQRVFVNAARPEDAILFVQKESFLVNTPTRIGRIHLPVSFPSFILYAADVDNFLKYLKSSEREKIYVQSENGKVIFHAQDGSYFICQSMDHDYPKDLDPILSLEENIVFEGVDKASFLRSLDLLSVGLEDDHPNMRLVRKGSRLDIEAHSRSGSVSHDSLPVTRIGGKNPEAEISVIFDYKKMKEVVKTFTSDFFSWGIQNATALFTQFVVRESDEANRVRREAFMLIKLSK